MKKLGGIDGIADVMAGHPFRGAIMEDDNGNGYVIQLRNVDKSSNVDWDNVIKTNIVGRKEPNWLKPNDIIFVARGQHNFSTYIEELPFPTVCVPHFFIVRITNKNFLPAFVSWQMNQSLAQNYFESSAVGTSMKAINSTVLKNLEISEMPIQKQKDIIALHQEYLKERSIYQRLIDIREIEMKELADQLLLSSK